MYNHLETNLLSTFTTLWGGSWDYGQQIPSPGALALKVATGSAKRILIIGGNMFHYTDKVELFRLTNSKICCIV